MGIMKNINKYISLNLKAFREARGWSLDKAAKKTGVSKAMLGQIERQESSPTIATLWKIANGFHESFSSFLENKQNQLKESHYHSNRIPDIGTEKIQVTTLFPYDKQTKCEIFFIQLIGHHEHSSRAHENGVIEHVLVCEGNIEVLLNGFWHYLKKGEAMRFKADQPHGYRNPDATPASFHNIIHYPG